KILFNLGVSQEKEKTGEQGRGLGLAQARHIATLYFGKILASNSVGVRQVRDEKAPLSFRTLSDVGALFTLRLPALHVSAPRNSAGAPAAMPWLYDLVNFFYRPFFGEISVGRWVKSLAPKVESGLLGSLYLFAVFGLAPALAYFG